MTLQEKYIQKILPSLSGEGEVRLSTKNGGAAYMFPCPFCSHLRTTSGKVRSHKRTAILMPHPNCKYEYIFNCTRGYSPECKGEARGFHNFLIMYKPYLAERYKFERDHC